MDVASTGSIEWAEFLRFVKGDSATALKRAPRDSSESPPRQTSLSDAPGRAPTCPSTPVPSHMVVEKSDGNEIWLPPVCEREG